MKTKNSIQKNRKRITSDGIQISIRLNNEVIEKIDLIMNDIRYELDRNYSWGRIKRISVLRHAIYLGLKKIEDEIEKRNPNYPSK